MDKLSIGEIILKLRKEKGITQEQLGNFIGVSTAAVSKWESGISYPDITLLPNLATFFNVSIDALLNFKIELSDDEVMKIFIECESLFSYGDLNKAIEALNKIHRCELDPNNMLSGIYIEKNEFKKARNLLQTNLYKNINDIGLNCIGLANSYIKDKKDLNVIERYYNLSIEIKRLFSNKNSSAFGLSMEYLNFAETYLKFNEIEKALKMLENMVEDIKVNDINKSVKFKDFWCFNELSEGKRTITMQNYCYH